MAGSPSGRTKSTETGLTPARETFAVAVAKGQSLSDAYLQAYPRSKAWRPANRHAEASKLAATPAVQARVQQLLATAAKANEADITMVLAEYVQRLRADPRELTEVRVQPCRYCWGRAHRWQFTDGELEDAREAHEERRQARIEIGKPDPGPFNEKGGGGYTVLKQPNPECPACGGAGANRVMLKDSRGYSPAALALFGGVKQGKDGIEVKVVDRMDALLQIARHTGFFEADKDPAPPGPADFSALDDFYAEALAKSKAEAERYRRRGALLAAGESSWSAAGGDPVARSTDPGEVADTDGQGSAGPGA